MVNHNNLIEQTPLVSNPMASINKYQLLLLVLSSLPWSTQGAKYLTYQPH